MSAKKEVRIGVFIPSTVQLLDMSPIDIFYMCSPEYLTACNLPAPLIAQGIPSTIHYISTPETGTHLELTARVVIRVSKTILDREVQPGNLDILLIPGPDPSVVFGEEVLKFVRGHAEWKGEKGERTDVLSICTGVNVLAQGGAIKGRSASGPRAFVSAHRKQYPETTWVDDKRWVTDGNIWSSGGITNGQEMVAAYIRERFLGPAAEAAIAMADVGEKGIGYSKGKTYESMFFLWQILKAFVIGVGKQNTP